MPIQRPTPIAQQVTAELRQRILDRHYPPGGRLPSESELAKELQVSRATVRTVLAKFAAEGLILRKQGDGTYVNERIEEIDTQYGGMWDFSRLIKASGFAASIQMISLEAREVTAVECEALAIAPTEQVISLTRLFCADQQPVILVHNVLPRKLIQTVPSKINGSLPIHKMMKQYSHEQIAYVISEIEAAFISSDIAQHLPKKVDQPILKLIEAFYNKHNRPLVLGTSYFDHTVLKLRLVQAWG